MDYTLRDVKPEGYGVPGEGPVEKYYPRLEFELAELPEIATWQVGEEYDLVIKVRMKSYDQSIEANKMEECACFEVLAVGAAPEQPMKILPDDVKKKLGI